jgi:hypothetical protein
MAVGDKMLPLMFALLGRALFNNLKKEELL